MDQSSRSFRFHSWCLRAPWAVFGLGPLLFLAGAYLIACLYLWSVWTIFLPGADTPFGVRWTGSAVCIAESLFSVRQVLLFRRADSRWLGNGTYCRPPKNESGLADP